MFWEIIIPFPSHNYSSFLIMLELITAAKNDLKCSVKKVSYLNSPHKQKDWPWIPPCRPLWASGWHQELHDTSVPAGHSHCSAMKGSSQTETSCVGRSQCLGEPALPALLGGPLLQAAQRNTQATFRTAT